MKPCKISFPASLGDQVFIPKIGMVGRIIDLQESDNRNQQARVEWIHKDTKEIKRIWVFFDALKPAYQKAGEVL